MFACDVATAFAGVTSRGLPGVLIKITSGSSYMLIEGALKMMPPLHVLMGGGGRGCLRLCLTVWEGCAFVVCMYTACVCVCVCASPCLQEEYNSCWGGGSDSRGELTLHGECGQEEMLTIGLSVHSSLPPVFFCTFTAHLRQIFVFTFSFSSRISLYLTG